MLDIIIPNTQIGKSLVFKRLIVEDRLKYRLFEISYDFSQMISQMTFLSEIEMYSFR